MGMTFPRVCADNALFTVIMPGVSLPPNRPSWSQSLFYSIFICNSFIVLSNLYSFPILFSSHSIPFFMLFHFFIFIHLHSFYLLPSQLLSFSPLPFHTFFSLFLSCLTPFFPYRTNIPLSIVFPWRGRRLLYEALSM
jgi:hypothetical protein